MRADFSCAEATLRTRWSLRVMVHVISTCLMIACSGDKRQGEQVPDTTGGVALVPANPETEDSNRTRIGASERVTLGAPAYVNAGIEITRASAAAARASSEALELPAIVSLDPSRIAIVSSRAPGRLERVAAVPGQRVAAGQIVALLTSPAYLTAQSDYIQARIRLVAVQGTGDQAGAQALLAAARDRLALLGASGDDVARLDAGGKPSFQLPVRAPFGASILDALALPGAAVDAGTPIFRIADLSSIDVSAQVPQQALASVHAGQSASVSVPAYPSERFTGRVVRLQDVVDTVTRTVGAVIRVSNIGYRLRPGMFATARLSVPTALASLPQSGGVILPASAVVTDAGRQYVFVEVGPRTFERRPVVIESLTPNAGSAPASGVVRVRSGVQPGERVVVRGAFTLQSELAKAKLREDE